MSGEQNMNIDAARARLRALYGENKKIEDGAFDASLAVACVNGTFVGERTDGVIAYRGIPYAKAPVGGLRWKAPVEAAADDGVYEARYFGKIPRQTETVGQMGSLYPQDEDGLHLNVWKADDESGEKKPVMVWIHGGAFELGSTVEPREEGCAFVRENPDVILVSIEYRVGPLGFIHLSHLPDGADYEDAQNAGLMDQLMALKWVHENIAGFGGDPDNVTIFGQSAGGGSVSLLPLVEGSHRYFRRIIAQSGSPSLCQSTEQAIASTDRLMEALGCTTVADLQKVDVDELIQTAGIVLGMRTAPVRDGKFLPLNAWEAYVSGAAKDLDIMSGCTKDEFSYFTFFMGVDAWNAWGAERVQQKLDQLPDDLRALLESYCADITGESYESTCRPLDQIWFNAPAFRTAEEQTRAGGRAFAYYFTVEASLPPMRSGHAVELSTLFNHAEETQFTGRQFDATFGKILRKMWVQFAKTGDPSLPAEISPDGEAKVWPLYDTENKYTMVFEEFNVRAEKESALGAVDWERTYPLTDYYVL